MSDSNLEKILIIDDNSDYRKLIKTFISKLLPGAEVIEYDPVFEGVPDDSFNWSDIDVLLLDYHLSIVGTTGLDILHKHHKKNTFPATIMLTGAGTEEIAVRALKTGIYEYLPKQSLTKDKLKQSVIHAWEDKKALRKKKQELTQHNRSFSKEVFYENLERAFDSNLSERVLIIIKPDNLDLVEEQIGVIGKDRLINYIAKNSYDTFKLGACNPNITKISDTEIGVQIDCPNNLETLSFNMQGLCDHLTKSTFKFADEKYVFSVSIGVLKLGLFNKTAEQLIYIASKACDNASNSIGNSFYIWQESDALPESIEQSQNNVSAAETSSTTGNEEVEARIKAAEEEKEKLQAQLKAKEEAEQAQAALKAEQEAKEKAEAEARIKAAEEEKEKLQAQLKAKEEAEKVQAALKAEQEAKEKAEAEMLAIEEEKKKLEAELKAREEAEKTQATLKAEQEAKEKAEAEAKIKAAEEEKKKLEAELKAKEEEAKAQATLKAQAEAAKAAEEAEKSEAEAKIKAAEEEKKKLEAELKAREEEAKAQAALKAEQEAKEKAEAEAKIKAAEEEKEKLEAELKAKEEAEKTQAAHAEQEAKEKAEAEEKIKTAEEEKKKLEAELKAKEEEAKAQAALKAEQEAKEKAEAEAKIKAAEEEKEKLQAQLKAKEEAEKEQAALREEQEAKEKAEAEAKIKAAEEEKEKLQAQLKAKEEAEKEQAALLAEQEAKEKAEAEAKMSAAQQEREKLEAELKAIAKAKEEAEAEMRAAREEKEKLEAELKAIAEAKTKQETQPDTVVEKPVESKEVTPQMTETKKTESTNTVQEETKKQVNEEVIKETKQEDETEKNNEPSIEQIEAQINKLIDENKIIQTYQPVTAMFEDETDPREIYKTGLQALSENETLNEYLADTSVFSLTLQQTINEWTLRQIFLRITESGTSDCQYLFLVSATESWFSDIALFQWLQKILQQTKKYNPGKSIIVDVPLDLFSKHQKRAQALIDTLRKTHNFTISLSNLISVENLPEQCSMTASKLLTVNIEQLKQLSETLGPNVVKEESTKDDSDNEEEQEEKQTLLQYIKSKNIKIITNGIEDSTLLTDAITIGTDYTLGDFVGETQENLADSSMVESFELT